MRPDNSTPSRAVRVLVVDDSAYMRKVIREMLEQDNKITVVGTAHNGLDALEQVQRLKPDVVTTDLYMPDMDGVQFTKQQMVRQALPIVVISSAQEEAEQVMAAMDAGAVEFVRKPTSRALDTMFRIQQELVFAVHAAALIPPTRLSQPPPSTQVPESPPSGGYSEQSGISVILIGISTGGPRALRAILPRLPASLPVPIVIAMHMPVGYTSTLAKRLDEVSEVKVVESQDGLELKPGQVILAQAGKHTRLRRCPYGQVETEVSDEPQGLLYYPSVDELFRSAAEVYGSQVLGIVMTGMGNDGTAGSAWIKAQGGKIFAEAENSCVVYGMPRSVVEAGVVDKVVDLEDMPAKIMEALR